MSTTADGREIYVLGNKDAGNREVVMQEDGSVHDLPAAAETTYASQAAKFPYDAEV
jgi:hypothetical protein